MMPGKQAVFERVLLAVRQLMISVTGLCSIRGGSGHGLWYQRGVKNGGGTDDSTKELHRHGLS